MSLSSFFAPKIRLLPFRNKCLVLDGEETNATWGSPAPSPEPGGLFIHQGDWYLNAFIEVHVSIEAEHCGRYRGGTQWANYR